MQRQIEQRISDIAKSRSLQIKLIAVLLVVSLVIVPGVFWWLKLTGITMAGDAFCGKTEHVHSTECYENNLTCTDETQEHSDACYETLLVCALEEHVHIESCYSDDGADVETSEDWELTVSDVVLSGSIHQDLVAIAKTQLGYTESTLNFILDEDGNRRGYTRYGEWYGHPYGEWSAMFIAFCFEYAGFDNMPVNSGVEAMRLKWDELGIYHTIGAYEPISGDLIFLDKDENGTADAVGIISSVDAQTISVIEGELSDAVGESSYNISDSCIIGYGSIDEAVVKTATQEETDLVQNAIEAIDALPDADTVESTLLEYENNGDMVSYLEYYTEVGNSVKGAYALVEVLDDLSALVTNLDKLDELSWMCARTFAVGSSVNIHQVNSYQTSGSGLASTTIVYGGTISNKLSGNVLGNMLYWDAYVIEKSSAGFYVSQIVKSGTAKASLKASTSDGFIVLVHSSFASWSAELGDWVEVSFDYKTKASYKAAGYGTVTVVDTDNSSKLSTVKSADTRELIEVNLYDYDATKINTKWSENNQYPGFQWPTGVTSDEKLTTQNDYSFGDNIVADYPSSRYTITLQGGEINNLIRDSNGDYANYPLSDTMNTSLVSGYPALASANGGYSLKYLFSDNTYATKMNSQSINGLFQYDEITGKYYFDSRNNHAQYNDSDDTFTLYKQIITSNYIMYPFGNFLPFNDIKTETTQTSLIDNQWYNAISLKSSTKYSNNKIAAFNTLTTYLNKFITMINNYKGSTVWDYLAALDLYFTKNADNGNGVATEKPVIDFADMYNIDFDEQTNFFFGMDMHMEFIQPKGGMTGLDGNQKMVYDFIGDDDVWVYVDGKLFLDLSGIHRHVGGKIDFVNGKVHYYYMNPQNGEISSTPYKTLTFADILGSTDGLNENGTFTDYSTHKMDFYYMERGSGSSVCEMSFNLPLIHPNSISVSKELTTELDIEEMLGNPDFSFQILKENGTDLFIGAGVEYTIYDENGNNIGTGKTDVNGVFNLKAGQTAVFDNIFDDGDSTYFVRELLDESVFEQFGTITVDGRSVTKDDLTDVDMNGENFKGVDSPVKNVDEGSTFFTFDNHLDSNKLGSLKIEKVLLQDLTTVFSFYVTLDGEPLPVGSGYTVLDKEGLARLGVVEEEGMVYIASGETAIFERIIAGTEFTVQEIGAEELGYTVFYRGEDVNVVDGVATGIVKASTPVEIQVVNTEKGSYIEIPYEKTLISPDSTGHRYYFSLTEVTNSTGVVEAENGITMESTIFVKDNRSGSFMIPFALADMKSSEDVYYFKVAEIKSENDLTTIYDETFYVYEVTVTKNENNDVLTEVTGVWKNGSEAYSSETASFTNRNVRSLTITKSVEGEEEETDTAFRFTIMFTYNDSYLEGDFTVTTNGISSTFTVSDGIGVIHLKDGEKAVISGLPYGTEWTISETTVDGYFPSYKINGSASLVGSTSQGTLTENTTVDYINSTGYVLPETGDNAMLIYALGGATVILAPLVYGCMLRRRKKKTER